MVHVRFAPSIQKHQVVPDCDVAGGTVSEVLGQVFVRSPTLRGYVLDDQGAVRQHVAIFVNDRNIVDRQHLSDPLSDDDQVYVFQALSGG